MQIFVRTLNNEAVLALCDVNPSSTVDHVLERCSHSAHSLDTQDMRLVHGGRSLLHTDTLAAANITDGSTLELLPRLRGGGGDGGSTGAESRSSYLAMYAEKKPDKINPEEERIARWSTCQLSGMPLESPIVCDEVGNMYNKDAIIQALLGKTIPKQIGYITSLKHLIDLDVEFTNKKGETPIFSCPLTGLTSTGKNPFVVIRLGGKGKAHVFSERALREVPNVVEEVVGGKWAAEDVLKLSPVGEELEAKRRELAAIRDKERAEKKSKKASKRQANGNDVEPVAAVSLQPQPAAKKLKSIAEELMPANANPEVWNSLFSKKEEPNGEKKKNNDYMTRGGLKYVV